VRQTVANPTDSPYERTLVAGGNVGERIDAARIALGISKADLARALGHKTVAQVSKWISGTKDPSPGSLRALSEVLRVTVDELLGVAEGQDPPFGAWREFLASPEAAGLTVEERRALRSFAWPALREPTVTGYVAILGAMRVGSRPRG